MTARRMKRVVAFRLTAALLFIALVEVATVGCTIKGPVFGDVAVMIDFENRREEAVSITIKYDGEDAWGPELTVQPGARVRGPMMIRSTGAHLRGTTESGKVVLDRHYKWEDLPPGESFTIVIEP